MGLRSRDERGGAKGVVLGALAVVVLVGLLTVVAGLTFSVNVVGSSMEPTLREGDRLEINPFDKGALQRFDVVEAIPPNGGAPVVKRIIGMPGDQVKVAGGKDEPEVYVKPARSQMIYLVENGTWYTTYEKAAQVCCDSAGKGTSQGWAAVPEDSYWVLGDNWSGSTDSRSFGWVRKSDVQAKVWFRIMPADRFGKLPGNVRLVLEQ